MKTIPVLLRCEGCRALLPLVLDVREREGLSFEDVHRGVERAGWSLERVPSADGATLRCPLCRAPGESPLGDTLALSCGADQGACHERTAVPVGMSPREGLSVNRLNSMLEAVGWGLAAAYLPIEHGTAAVLDPVCARHFTALTEDMKRRAGPREQASLEAMQRKRRLN